MSGIELEFHLFKGIRFPAGAWFPGEPNSEGMAAPSTVESPRSNFIREKHVEEGILFWSVGKTSSHTKTETRFINTEVVYRDCEVSVGRWECGELVEFVLHIPFPIDLCM